MFNINVTHRNFNEHCRYWKRNESDEFTDDELVMKRIPDGDFWAREANSEHDHNNIIGGVFLLNKTNVTIETYDNVLDLKSEDLVEYQGEKWIVVDVQHKKTRVQNSLFVKQNQIIRSYYIELRK